MCRVNNQKIVGKHSDSFMEEVMLSFKEFFFVYVLMLVVGQIAGLGASAMWQGLKDSLTPRPPAFSRTENTVFFMLGSIFIILFVGLVACAANIDVIGDGDMDTKLVLGGLLSAWLAVRRSQPDPFDTLSSLENQFDRIMETIESSAVHLIHIYRSKWCS